jgi:hypothetical protein
VGYEENLRFDFWLVGSKHLPTLNNKAKWIWWLSLCWLLEKQRERGGGESIHPSSSAWGFPEWNFKIHIDTLNFNLRKFLGKFKLKTYMLRDLNLYIEITFIGTWIKIAMFSVKLLVILYLKWVRRKIKLLYLLIIIWEHMGQ